MDCRVKPGNDTVGMRLNTSLNYNASFRDRPTGAPRRMIPIVESLLSVFATILLGYVLRLYLLPDRVVWAGLERLAFFVLLPALLVHSLATSEIAPGAAWRLVAAVLGAILVISVATFPLRRALNLTGPAFASVFQGATRMNSYVILGVSGTLIGPSGVALASLALAAMAVLVNALAVLVLARYGHGGSGGAAQPPSLARSLAGNPLILACILGVLWNMSGAPMPAPTPPTWPARPSGGARRGRARPGRPIGGGTPACGRDAAGPCRAGSG